MTETMSPVLATANTLVLGAAATSLIEAGLDGNLSILIVGLFIGFVAVAFAITYVRECRKDDGASAWRRQTE